MGGGWWRLTYAAAVADASLYYGVQALAGKTIYVDGIQLEDKSYSTTYTDGSLGIGYAWVGVANNSASTRNGGAIAKIDYPTAGNISGTAGTVSMWINRKYFIPADNGWGYKSGYFTSCSGGECNDGEFSVLTSGTTGSTLNCVWGATGVTTDINTWYHITVTWDNSATTRKCYVNAVEKYSNSAVTTVVNRIGVGFGTNWSDRYKNDAVVSDLRIYDKALTSDQVGILYSSGLDTHSISSESDDRYASTGTYTSSVIDLSNAGQWGQSPNFEISQTLNSGSNSITFQTRTSEDGETWTDYADVTGATPNWSIGSVANRYLQFAATLNSPDQATTPQFSLATIHYVQDADPPSANASEISMWRVNGADAIAEDQFTNSPQPYLSWQEGADNLGGSGLRGYCVYLGSNINGDPEFEKGLLGTSPGSIANTTCPFVVTTEYINFATSSLRGASWLTSSTSPYYFKLKAVDLTGNVYQGDAETFRFYYDDTPPTNPSGIFSPTGYQRDLASFIVIWPSTGTNAAQDDHSHVLGYQYRLGGDGTWYGDSHSGTEGCSDILPDTTYTLDSTYDTLPVGETPIYLRTLDYACNVSVSAISAILKYNAQAPSRPENLTVTPTTNTVNLFEFDWEKPTEFSGSEFGLSYCYTVNTLPTSATCVYTAQTSLATDAYATQPGENTFYVVSRDEAGNINLLDYASVKFTANTPAPSIARNVEVADISVKSTENWRLAISWDEPTDVGAGISNYRLYRSTSETSCATSVINYALVSTTSGTSYVDSGLIQQDYYYCVRACDSTNNCSAVSATSSGFPDGKFTEPAPLLSNPVITRVSTRSATINWITQRTADSKIAFGITSDDYFEEEIGSSEQIVNHTININNLSPGTIYFYRAKWTDEDGNTGISDESTFTTSPPPQVKEVSVGNVGISSAILSFTVQGAVEARILYGTSLSFGGVVKTPTSAVESRYTLVLDNLRDGTKYYYRIDTVDSDNYTYEGTVLDFTTLPRPQITDVQVEQVKNTAQPTILVMWKSNTEITSIIDISPDGKPENVREEIDLTYISGEHEFVVRGLDAETTYTLLVKGSDKVGNLAIGEAKRITTATDTRPPQIQNVRIQGESKYTQDNGQSSQLIIAWNTDEATTSQVEYSEGTGTSYAVQSPVDSSLTYNHTVVISSLTPGKVYHLRVISVDNSGNKSNSNDYVTITPQSQDNALDLVITNLSKVFNFLR